MPKNTHNNHISCVCAQCGAQFTRTASGVKNKKYVYCNPQCKNKHQEVISLGKNNPNYKYGQVDSVCSCGNRKDYRAQRCAICSHKSYPIDSKNLPSMEEIIEAVKISTGYKGTAEKLRYSRSVIRNLIIENEIDTSHFVPAKKRKMAHDKLFTKGTQKRYGTVKREIMNNNILEYKCVECGITREWNGKVIFLDLDHANGDPTDNRIENLRFLCPNCHSQTPTYGSKVRKMETNKENGGV